MKKKSSRKTASTAVAVQRGRPSGTRDNNIELGRKISVERQFFLYTLFYSVQFFFTEWFRVIYYRDGSIFIRDSAFDACVSCVYDKHTMCPAAG